MFSRGSDFYWFAGFGFALVLGYVLPELADSLGVHRSLGSIGAIISSVLIGKHCA